MNELPTYRVQWDSEEDGIVYGISIVDTPANEMEFITMSKDKPLIQLSETNKEKQLLTGVVLIPNQLIYRDIKGKKFNLTFEADTIEKLAFEYIERGYQKNSMYNHELELQSGISVVESWITGDNDKAKDYGFDVPKGTWMVTMRLNDELWQTYVKSGKVSGFSIDSFLNIQKLDFKINNKNNNNMNVKAMLQKAINMLEDTEEVKMAELVVDGVKYVSDSFAEGDKVFIEDAEGDRVEASEVSIVNDGMVHTTDENGVVISVLPLEGEASEEIDELAEAMKLLDENEDLKMKIKEELMKEDKEAYEAKLAEKEKEMEEVSMKSQKLSEELEAKNSELKALKKELEVTPSDVKLKAHTASKTASEMSLSERLASINAKAKG